VKIYICLAMGVLLVVQRGEVLTEAAQQTCCRAVTVRVTYVTLLCDSTVTEHKNRTGERGQHELQHQHKSYNCTTLQ